MVSVAKPLTPPGMQRHLHFELLVLLKFNEGSGSSPKLSHCYEHAVTPRYLALVQSKTVTGEPPVGHLQRTMYHVTPLMKMLRERLTPVGFWFGARQRGPLPSPTAFVERCIRIPSEVFCPVFPFHLLLRSCLLLEAIRLQYLARICLTWH